MCDATADGCHLSSGDGGFFEAKVESVSDALYSQPLDPNDDVDNILELNGPGIVALGINSRPADGARLVLGDHASAQVPKEGVFGLFHVLKVGREVSDSGCIGLAELDSTLVMELVHNGSLEI